MGWQPAFKETVRDCSIAVVEPTHTTEFEVQAYLWSSLRALGYNARGEVKCRFKNRAQVRFDIAVFEGGKLSGLIEVKRAEKQANTDWTGTRQGIRYGQFGVPVRLVKGMEDAARVIADAEAGALWGVAKKAA